MTSVSNKPGINLVLWYRLVGCMSYYFHLSVKISGLQWYVTDRSHLGAVRFRPEQARWVKTVKVQIRAAKPYLDQTVGYSQGRPWIVIAIDWVTYRSAPNELAQCTVRLL